MQANAAEVELLRAELAGARSRIEELAANGRRIITLEQQIATIRVELERYQKANGEAASVTARAREDAARIIEQAKVHAGNVARRAAEILAAAEHDADLLRAASLDEGGRRAAAILEEARQNAREIRTAARHEAEALVSRAVEYAGTNVNVELEQTTGPVATETIDEDGALRLTHQVSTAGVRSRKTNSLPRLGIEDSDIWAKASRKPR